MNRQEEMTHKSILTFLFSTSLLCQGLDVPNLCDAAFFKGYSAYFVKSERDFSNIVTLASIRKIEKAPTLAKKMDSLGREYNLLSMQYYNKIEQLEVTSKNMVKNKKLDPEIAQAELQKKKQSVFNENIQRLNALTSIAYQSMISQGIQVVLKTRATKGTRLVSTYIELINLPAKKYTKSIEIIKRYKKRFGTKTVTFDLAQNMKSQSAGFSQEATKRIDLGFRGLRNILTDDLITMVGKHEFKHAAFAANRLNGKKSIYHADYLSIDGNPISSVENGYSHYMSAEELYNFANNPFWASNRIADISKYNPADYVNDINGINYYIKETTKLAKQTVEVTEATIEYLKAALKDPIRLSSDMAILKIDRSLATSSDEAYNVAFKMPTGVQYTSWIGAPEFKKDIASLISNRKSLANKYEAAYNAAIEPERSKIFAAYAKEELSVNSFVSKAIVRSMIDQQTTLNKVAKELIPLNEAAVVKTQSFIDYLNMKGGIYPNYLQSSAAKEEFSQMRKVYRNLGNHVKEDFKGFIGN